jgi:hypothetical protein
MEFRESRGEGAMHASGRGSVSVNAKRGAKRPPTELSRELLEVDQSEIKEK